MMRHLKFSPITFLPMVRWLQLMFALVATDVLMGEEGRESGVVNSVKVEFFKHESPGTNTWPEEKVFEFTAPAMAFDRIPQCYNANGIRDDWPNPLWIKASCRVEMPGGRHRFLLRSRRAARLWVDGAVIASNPFPPNIRDGQDPVERPCLDLGPNVRFPAPGDQESLIEWEIEAGFHLIQLEFCVGGYAGKQNLRPETGETLVAVSYEGDATFYLVGSVNGIALTDEAWRHYHEQRNATLDRMDQDRRRQLAASRQHYWNNRHDHARAVWAKMTDQPDFNSQSIDTLVVKKIQEANRTLADAGHAPLFRDGIQNVQKLLSDRCLSCHGSKAKGGLKLDTLSSALEGGDSGRPALKPGRPDESLMLQLIQSGDPDERMPPKGKALSEQEIDLLEDWISQGASWSQAIISEHVTPMPLTDDWEFLRRVSLDVLGIPPSEEMIRQFEEDRLPGKRLRWIDRVLEDPLWADHWVGYWQDVLAENPTIVNPTLNNTGPFRWWLYESFLDNKSMDRMVSELVMMEGSVFGGGPAGFELATQNDVPMAAKANILTTAFLGVDMKCSRCHDAPFHDHTQKQLFGIAGMLAGKPITVPASSSVPLDQPHQTKRNALIRLSVKPGDEVSPAWEWDQWTPKEGVESWLNNPKDTREQLAFLLTSPQNTRFPRVIVNRLWKRLMGSGIVEPVDDWEHADPTHPALLDYLAHYFVRNDYDLKAVTRLILNSDTYQRRTSLEQDVIRMFGAPGPRQMTAEQIVDTLFAVTGKPMNVEPLTVDIGGGRPWANAVHLGNPSRAWMFGGLANNRDRPSLTLPRVQAVTDVLSAFGWRASRQEPLTDRKTPLTPLQPAILNNGTMMTWLTRLSDDHPLTEIAMQVKSPGELVERLYQRILSRKPDLIEKREGVSAIQEGFYDRILSPTISRPAKPSRPPLYVTWANHLQPEATHIQLEATLKAKQGDPPSQRLDPSWRERMEDLVWSLLNLPETIYYP